MPYEALAKKGAFQSTLPVWGGTPHVVTGSIGVYNFNPPSPCGEGLRGKTHRLTGPDFNPPSPCGEGLACSFSLYMVPIFQSTLPVWGGTWVRYLRTARI